MLSTKNQIRRYAPINNDFVKNVEPINAPTWLDSRFGFALRIIKRSVVFLLISNCAQRLIDRLQKQLAHRLFLKQVAIRSGLEPLIFLFSLFLPSTGSRNDISYSAGICDFLVSALYKVEVK